MVKNLVIEIRDFFSLREIVEDLEERIAQYSLVKEEYSRELGSYLRKTEEKYGDEDWFKRLSLHKLNGSGKEGKKEDKRREKRKKGRTASSSWVPYKGLSLSSTDQGEMELLFEATEELGKKIDKLIEVKKVVEELMKVGVGENLKYRIYIRGGVPQKIVLRPKEGEERFTLNMVFSTIK